MPIKPTQNSNYPTQKTSPKRREKRITKCPGIYNYIWLYTIMIIKAKFSLLKSIDWLTESMRRYLDSKFILNFIYLLKWDKSFLASRTYKDLCDISGVSLKRERGEGRSVQVLALYGTCNHATDTKVSMKQHVYSLKIFEGRFASQLFFGVKRIVPLKLYMKVEYEWNSFIALLFLNRCCHLYYYS